jgi:hypothetical protein
MRFLLAFKWFFIILFKGIFPIDPRKQLPAPAPEPIDALSATPPTEPKEKDGKDARIGGAVQLLALLQREGRLLDFLQEEIESYSDAQIGAAVRDIHRGCKKALAEHLPIEPVLRDQENATVRVDPGFDPSRIRLTGKVMGEPPYTGTLRHHGWRTAKVTLPLPTAATDPLVVAPAEVEIA